MSKKPAGNKAADTHVPKTIKDLVPDPDNPRRIGDEELGGLTTSVQTFGDISGIVFNTRSGHLVCGHQRLAALQKADKEPKYDPATCSIVTADGKRFAVRLVDWDETKEKMANVAANSPYIAGQWTPELGPILDGLKVSAPELLTDLRLEELRIDVPTLATGPEDGLTDPDDVPEAEADDPITKPGDLWLLGEHRVLCGDCTDAADMQRACDGKTNGVFTSPPYAEQRKEQYGGIPADEYVDWWEAIQANVREVLADDGSFFVNIKPHCEAGERSLYVMDLVLAMSRRWAWSFVDEFCWLRSGVPREVRYTFKNGFEPVFQFAVSRKGFKFRPDAVRHESDSVPVPGGVGAGQTNWAGKQGQKPSGGSLSKLQSHSSWIFGGQKYEPGMAYPSNVLKAVTNDKCRGHEAAFPVGLPAFFVTAYSDEGDAWLDPFLGSGTTVIAAEQLSRRCYGIEIEPKYVDVIVRRWQNFTGKRAKLEDGTEFPIEPEVQEGASTDEQAHDEPEAS